MGKDRPVFCLFLLICESCHVRLAPVNSVKQTMCCFQSCIFCVDFKMTFLFLCFFLQELAHVVNESLNTIEEVTSNLESRN